VLDTPSSQRRLEYQMSLFEDLQETDLLFADIQDIRTSLHKMRKKLFKEVDDLQTEVKHLKDQVSKFQFVIARQKEEEIKW
jgi:septal ring factor EnvC (AmiA/AmiB activator)